METLMGPEDFWASSSLVDSYVAQSGALPYEVDAIRTAIARAERTGAVRSVHVIGVGAGRELPAVRDAAPAASIHAWDISGPMVDACRAFVDAAGLDGVQVERSDAADLVLGDGDAPADVVIGLGAVLGYSTEPEQRTAALRALAALLRPGAGIALVVQQRNGRPDWAAWFALRGVLDRLRGQGAGNRRSRHGSTSVLFHHYTRREIADLLIATGFDDVTTMSLRQWGRIARRPIPLRSPNPLVVIATAGGTPVR